VFAQHESRACHSCHLMAVASTGSLCLVGYIASSPSAESMKVRRTEATALVFFIPAFPHTQDPLAASAIRSLLKRSKLVPTRVFSTAMRALRKS
jgi:hypothetical protein